MDVQIVMFPETKAAAIEHFGPNVREEDMITDVYLPLRRESGR